MSSYKENCELAERVMAGAAGAAAVRPFTGSAILGGDPRRLAREAYCREAVEAFPDRIEYRDGAVFARQPAEGATIDKLMAARDAARAAFKAADEAVDYAAHQDRLWRREGSDLWAARLEAAWAAKNSAYDALEEAEARLAEARLA